MQIARDLKSFSKYTENLTVVPVYGGANISIQIKALKKGCQIVVGTPGRVYDLIKRKILKVSAIEWLVLDEADEMLSMGFEKELTAILEETPKERQTLLFSATMPKKITNKYMNDPKEIIVGKRNAGNDNIEHLYYMVQAKNKYKALKRIADINPDIYGIVFCRTRQDTKDIAEKLLADGYNADALHGDLTQDQRDYVMGRFRKKHLQILVATDVAARGLDVNDLTHIINYSLPDETEAYIHRSGRTGRAGKKGVSVSIVHSREMNKLRAIENKVKKTFEKTLVPGGRDICEKQILNSIDKVKNVEINEKHMEEFLPAIYEKLESLSREELIKHFVSVEFNKFLSYYKEASDLNSAPSENKKRNEQRNKKNDKRRPRGVDSVSYTHLRAHET